MSKNVSSPKDKGLQARLAALYLMRSVLRKNTPLDQALEREEMFLSLDQRDRGFARMLTATLLRRKGQIEDLVRRCLTRPENTVEANILGILKLGTAQILFMDVPDHAAVDTSVRLAEHLGLTKAKGMINAVLRRITREGHVMASRQNAARINTPDWLWDAWEKDWGNEKAEQIAYASQEEAPLDVNLKNSGMADFWAEKLEADHIGGGTLRRPAGGFITELAGYEEGMWWIQDYAASQPVRMLAEVCDIRDATVIDLCAAPGGKTAQLACHHAAKVTAVDRNKNRLKHLEENIERLDLKDVEIVCADAGDWQPEDQADIVVLDAPCSATGTIRRHPDLPWLKSEQDVAKLTALQSRLLDRAVTMVKPGGTLVYCTCSLQKCEGEEQIAALKKKNSALHITQRRIFPFQAPIQDGFYIATIKV